MRKQGRILFNLESNSDSPHELPNQALHWIRKHECFFDGFPILVSLARFGANSGGPVSLVVRQPNEVEGVMGARVESKERYAALANMWIHQNATQFQWPTLILSAVFVAVSVLLDNETVTAMAMEKPEKWVDNPQV